MPVILSCLFVCLRACLSDCRCYCNLFETDNNIVGLFQSSDPKKNFLLNKSSLHSALCLTFPPMSLKSPTYHPKKKSILANFYDSTFIWKEFAMPFLKISVPCLSWSEIKICLLFLSIIQCYGFYFTTSTPRVDLRTPLSHIS